MPIGVWTEDYKSFLDNISENEKWLKNYKNNCTEKDILFEIKTNDFKFIEKMNEDNKLIQILRLSKNINLTNMHCFSSNGKLKKYNSINDILNEFYNFRLEGYEKRKIYLIKTLKENILIENSKLQFIKAVISNKLKLYQMEDDKIVKELDRMKLYKNNGYDYLLNLSIRGITKNKIKDLENKINEIKKDLNKINKMTSKDLWITDLKKI